jgi:hypothetical protein
LKTARSDGLIFTSLGKNIPLPLKS